MRRIGGCQQWDGSMSETKNALARCLDSDSECSNVTLALKKSTFNYHSASFHELKSPKHDNKSKNHKVGIADIKEPGLQDQKYSPAQLTAWRTKEGKLQKTVQRLLSLARNHLFFLISLYWVSHLWHVASSSDVAGVWLSRSKSGGCGTEVQKQIWGEWWGVAIFKVGGSNQVRVYQ